MSPIHPMAPYAPKPLRLPKASSPITPTFQTSPPILLTQSFYALLNRLQTLASITSETSFQAQSFYDALQKPLSIVRNASNKAMDDLNRVQTQEKDPDPNYVARAVLSEEDYKTLNAILSQIHKNFAGVSMDLTQGLPTQGNDVVNYDGGSTTKYSYSLTDLNVISSGLESFTSETRTLLETFQNTLSSLNLQYSSSLGLLSSIVDLTEEQSKTIIQKIT